MKTEYLVFIANAALYSAVLSNDGYVAAAVIAALTALGFTAIRAANRQFITQQVTAKLTK